MNSSLAEKVAVPDSSRSQLAMRLATPDDLHFIVQQILDGARNGHFERRMLTPPQTELLHREIDSIIRHRRRTDKPLDAIAFIFTAGTDAVGHAIMTEVNGIKGLEIYTMALDERRRGTGMGAAILDMLIAQFLPQAGALYARCFPRTVAMYELLISRGFEYTMTMRYGLRVLCLNPQRANTPTP